MAHSTFTINKLFFLKKTRTLDSGDAESHTLQVLTGPDFTVTEDHIPVDETDRDAELVMLDSCNDLAVAVAVSGLDT